MLMQDPPKALQPLPPSSPPPLSPPDRRHLPLLRGDVLLQVVGHGDVQQGIVLCLLPPSVTCAEVGEDDDLAAEEDCHAVVELAESAGGVSEQQMCPMYDNFDEMNRAGYPYTYRESEGGHIWRNWRIYLTC